MCSPEDPLFKPRGVLTLKRGTGCAALKTPFSHSLSSSLRPPFSMFQSFSKTLFSTNITNFTKFAILEPKFVQKAVPKPKFWQKISSLSPMFFKKKIFLCAPIFGAYPFFKGSRMIRSDNAAVNGHLELTLLKARQRFDAISTSNLEVYKFRDWWILTYFIFGLGESSPNNIWSTVNLERTFVFAVLLFCLEVNLDLEKTNQLGESSPNFIFEVVNLVPIILEKRWIDGESWPNDFVEKVNRGEDSRWVGSRCPLTCWRMHKVSLWCVTLLINTRFRLFIL